MQLSICYMRIPVLVPVKSQSSRSNWIVGPGPGPGPGKIEIIGPGPSPGPGKLIISVPVPVRPDIMSRSITV